MPVFKIVFIKWLLCAFAYCLLVFELYAFVELASCLIVFTTSNTEATRHQLHSVQKTVQTSTTFSRLRSTSNTFDNWNMIDNNTQARQIARQAGRTKSSTTRILNIPVD
jgi:hypothetical protein